MVLGAGLEPASLAAYAPQTYVSAIPPPEQEEGTLVPCQIYSAREKFEKFDLFLYFGVLGLQILKFHGTRNI